MTITFIYGKPRTGKTLYLTMLGYFDLNAGRKLYANYNVNYENTRLDIKDILGIAEMEMDISEKTVLIQEASKWFDARRSMRTENVLLSSFTGQSGKREIDIYYDDQFYSRIDKALRDVTDYTFYCKCIRDNKKNPIMFEYRMYEGFPFEPNFQPTGKVFRFPAFAMQQFYSMYDTREPTKALKSPSE